MNLKKKRRLFCGKTLKPLIHEALCNDYNTEGLKNIDIPDAIIALQSSWIRRFYDNSFHEWKLISLYLIEKCFGRSINFQSNLLFKSNKTKFFAYFYRDFYHISIIFYWKKHLGVMTEIPSCILPQYL